MSVSELYIRDRQGVKTFVLVKLNRRFLNSGSNCTASNMRDWVIYIFSKGKKRMRIPASLIIWLSGEGKRYTMNKEISPYPKGQMLKWLSDWPLNAKSCLTGKDSDAGKDWGQEEKVATEDEMFRWHHQLNDMSLSNFWEIVKDSEAWWATVHWVTESDTAEQLSNWTTTANH